MTAQDFLCKAPPKLGGEPSGSEAGRFLKTNVAVGFGNHPGASRHPSSLRRGVLILNFELAHYVFSGRVLF